VPKIRVKNKRKQPKRGDSLRGTTIKGAGGKRWSLITLQQKEVFRQPGILIFIITHPVKVPCPNFWKIVGKSDGLWQHHFDFFQVL